MCPLRQVRAHMPLAYHFLLTPRRMTQCMFKCANVDEVRKVVRIDSAEDQGHNLAYKARRAHSVLVAVISRVQNACCLYMGLWLIFTLQNVKNSCKITVWPNLEVMLVNCHSFWKDINTLLQHQLLYY